MFRTKSFLVVLLAAMAVIRVQPIAAAEITNQELAERVAIALGQSHLKGYDVGIKTLEGVVTLKGTVADEAQKKLAAKVASAISGVKSVTNQLVVAAPRRPDQPFSANENDPLAGLESPNQELAERIARALGRSHLKGYDVSIMALQGAVTLQGRVADAAQKKLAGTVASAISGVNSVSNQLIVVAPVHSKETQPANEKSATDDDTSVTDLAHRVPL